MMKVLGMLKKGLVFVVSAPAGTGKTTLVRMLQNEFDCVVESISYTTRKPRQFEVPGKDYHFVSVAEFERKIQAGDFLEYAKVFGHYYGTCRDFLKQQQNLGKHVVLVIDTQGAMHIQGLIQAVFIFVLPPSLEILKARLLARNSESIEAMEERLKLAKQEMNLAPKYDYQIVNDSLDQAYDVLRSILIAEEHKTSELFRENTEMT
jgi:guanylate kinase